MSTFQEAGGSQGRDVAPKKEELKTPETTTTQEARSEITDSNALDAFGSQKKNDINNAAMDLVSAGQKRTDSRGEQLGFQASEVEEVKQETGLDTKLSGIQSEISHLKNQAEAGIEQVLESPEAGVHKIGTGESKLDASMARRAAEKSPEERKSLEVRMENARQMAGMLDSYTDIRVDHAVKEAAEKAADEGREFTDAERADLIETTTATMEKIKDFFVSVDAGKRPDTPLERMAQTYEYLEAPADPEARVVFEKAMADHKQELIERAFDQHLDNPEQYVSHGFDHSLNVADYTKSIIDMNKPIVDAMAEKYGITDGQARFMLENVALHHDCGYPHVGDKAKAVHGIAGADLVSSPKMQEMFRGMIQNPGAKLDELNHDFRDAILFHSADKVEHNFSTRINTTRGIFLTEGKHSYDVISIFNNPAENSSDVARDVTEIEVSDLATKAEIEEALARAAVDFKTKTGLDAPPVAIRVVGETFRGRFSDLKTKKDNKLGLEYSERDATEDPLHAIIRLADNMDMRSNRFSEFQREPANKEIYHAFGVEGQTNKDLKEIEDFSKLAEKMLDTAQTDEEKAMHSAGIAEESRKILGKIAATNPERFIGLSADRIAAIQTPKEADRLFKETFIEKVLSKDEYQAMPDEMKDKIRKNSLDSDTISMRHFGGCESISDVRLEKSKDGEVGVSMVIVTVDRAQFDKLNETTVTETSRDDQGNKSTVTVGVGEYQVWRAEEAYNSILVDGKKVEVRVVEIVTVDGVKQEKIIVPTYKKVVPNIS